MNLTLEQILNSKPGSEFTSMKRFYDNVLFLNLKLRTGRTNWTNSTFQLDRSALLQSLLKLLLLSPYEFKKGSMSILTNPDGHFYKKRISFVESSTSSQCSTSCSKDAIKIR